jgi:hypothetical protein
VRRLALVALTLLALGCVARIQRRILPATARDWLITLTDAQRAALEGRYREADELLVGFASAHPGTPEAREAPFWRALLMLDPANRTASVREAMRELDRYLASTQSTPHRTEALVLRRMAASVDSLRQEANEPASTVVITPLAPSPQEGSRDRQQALEREVQLLQEQLEKARTELERIKTRLAEPTLPPG